LPLVDLNLWSSDMTSTRKIPTLPILALATLTIAGMTGASAQNSSAMAASGAMPAADSAFMQKAAMGGMAEVQMGNLAQQKAASDQVKQFGARMVQDHSKANDQLKQIASSKGVTLPATPDKKSQQAMDKMQKLSGAAFDKAYMSDMVADHKHDIAEFQKEAKSGKDADVKGFAEKTLPTLQEHLKMAEAADKAARQEK
jgi:putative membrane protein